MANSGSSLIVPAILYTFRRCPYAIRARLALYASGLAVEIREVWLRDKPASMLAASPKGSVPVLVLPDESVIDKSWDIMLWALRRNDPDGWLGENECYVDAATPLVTENDTTFKYYLDRYKYADHYPEHTQEHYRAKAEEFVLRLEDRLQITRYLLGNTVSVADVAIFPFIRQFAEVDKSWFDRAHYASLRCWLKDFLDSERFAAVMDKHTVWHPGDPAVIMADNFSKRIALPAC